MTNVERVLVLIRSSARGLTDREIGERTRITPHQQVNQICNKLAARGLTRRERGPNGFFVNRPLAEYDGDLSSRFDVSHPTGASTAPATTWSPPAREGAVEEFDIPKIDLGSALIVIPCSGNKRQGGDEGGSGGVSIADFLSEDLAQELRNVRERNARVCQVDESVRMPAVERYCGTLYRAAGRTFEQLDGTGTAVAVMSGGYGVVSAHEQIGWYEREFDEAMWPNQLVARCLSAYAKAIGATTVVGLFGATTSYARAFSRAQWLPDAQNVWLVCPAPRPRDGAQVKVPRAIGEVLSAIASTGTVAGDWTSSDNVPLRIVRVSARGG